MNIEDQIKAGLTLHFAQQAVAQIDPVIAEQYIAVGEHWALQARERFGPDGPIARAASAMLARHKIILSYLRELAAHPIPTEYDRQAMSSR